MISTGTGRTPSKYSAAAKVHFRQVKPFAAPCLLAVHTGPPPLSQFFVPGRAVLASAERLRYDTRSHPAACRTMNRARRIRLTASAGRQCHIRDENTQIIVTIPTRGAVGIGAKQVYFFSIHCFRNDLADMGQFLFHFNRHPQHLLAEFIIPCGRTLSNLIFMIPEPRHSGNPSYLPMVAETSVRNPRSYPVSQLLRPDRRRMPLRQTPCSR